MTSIFISSLRSGIPCSSSFIQLTCHAANALELGYLLGKHSGSVFESEFSAGRVQVFYPEVSCDAAGG